MSEASEGPHTNVAPSGNEDFISLALDDIEDSSSEESFASDDVQVDKTVREHAAARSTPWCVDVPWHRCRNAAEMYVDLANARLHAEIETFSKWISPTQEEHSVRVMVIQLLQHALHSEWPDADVRSFGSQDTQLYLPQGYVSLSYTVILILWYFRRRWIDTPASMYCEEWQAACARITWLGIFK